MPLGDKMFEFGSVLKMTMQRLPRHDHAATDTRAQGEHHQVALSSSAGTGPILAEGGGVGIVFQRRVQRRRRNH